VNPLHFFLGDRDANNKDRAMKGRTVTPNMNLVHCKRGHSFDETNTLVRPNGTRMCRKCHNEGTLRRYFEKTGPRVKVKNGSSHCGQGHEFTKENTRIYNGCRQCKKCQIERQRERRARNV
jgi:hypothetical protein